MYIADTEIKSKILEQIEHLAKESDALAVYNFELTLEDRRGYETIIFTYSPDDVRKLSLNQPPPGK